MSADSMPLLVMPINRNDTPLDIENIMASGSSGLKRAATDDEYTLIPAKVAMRSNGDETPPGRITDCDHDAIVDEGYAAQNLFSGEDGATLSKMVVLTFCRALEQGWDEMSNAISDHCEENGISIMGSAAALGLCDAINFLHSKNYDFEEPDPNGLKPLHKAVEHRQLDAVKLMLSLGASVDETDALGNTALFNAVIIHKDDDAAALLLSHKALVSAKLMRNVFYSRESYSDQIIELLDKQCSQQDKDFNSPTGKPLGNYDEKLPAKNIFRPIRDDVFGAKEEAEEDSYRDNYLADEKIDLSQTSSSSGLEDTLGDILEDTYLS